MNASMLASPVNHPRGTIWVGDNLTALGHEIYTRGDCWALAWEIAVVTGGELVRLTHDTSTTYWGHMAVRVGLDQYLDANGLQTKEELEANWPGLHVHAYEWNTETFFDYRVDLNTEWHYGNARKQTRTIARKLVLSLGL